MNAEQKQAYEWAKNQSYQSVAAQYAKTLTGLVDELTAQLAESQRRERAAVRDLTFACGSQPSASDDSSICDICKNKQEDGSCPKQCFMNSIGASNRWQWRGPSGEGEGSR